MKFVIIGDSWGVGEWKIVNYMCESIPDTGIDYHLTQLGHTATNLSAGSAGNFGQLRNLYWHLKQGHTYDYIIWFYTESLRDIQQIIIEEPDEGRIQYPNFNIQNFISSLEYINHCNYQYAQKITKEFGISFVVIGGQSPVDTSIQQFNFAQHVITNWAGQLLNTDLSPLWSIIGYHKIEQILKHYNINLKNFIIEHADQLETTIAVDKLLQSSDLFPDQSHPSSECFKQLAQQVLLVL